MSDTMLLGVLRMPHELAMADDLSRSQCWSRAAEAADRIEADAERVAALQSRLARYEQPDDNEPVTGEWLRSIGFRRTGILPHGHTFVVDQLGGDAWVSVTIETGASSLDIGSVYGGLTFVRPNPTRGQVRRLIAALKGEP